MVAWVVAQSLKFCLAAFRGQLDFRYFYTSGGMPSAHSAVVVSLATVALVVSGVESSIFGLSAVFAAVVMYDSFGVRRASGEQAAAINRILLAMSPKPGQPQPAQLREVLGHNPVEVLVGAALGLIVSLAFYADKFTAQINYLTSQPGRFEIKLFVAIFGFIILAGLGVRFWLRKRSKTSAAWRGLGRAVLLNTEVIGVSGLVITLVQYETSSYLSWRLWSWVILLIWVIWTSVLINRLRKQLPTSLEVEHEALRKQKWLNWPQGKRKKR